MLIGFKGLVTARKLYSLAKFRKPCQKIFYGSQELAAAPMTVIGKPVS
jgi:hypothetical protein